VPITFREHTGWFHYLIGTGTEILFHPCLQTHLPQVLLELAKPKLHEAGKLSPELLERASYFDDFQARNSRRFDAMSESAMTTLLVPNAFAIGAFEAHPKPEMRSALSLRPNGLNVRWRC